MKIVALIPARSGSKRVPKKNIRFLGGIPLMAHSIITAKECSLIDEVVVSTDSYEYSAAVEQYSPKIIMRPEEISGDDSTDDDVVLHFLEHYPDTDLIIYLRPTTPLRSQHMIHRAINYFNTIEADSLRSVEEMSESAYKCFEIDGTHLIGLIHGKTNLPNHLYPKTYKANGYVDIIKSSIAKKHDDIWGYRTAAFKTPPVTEVDTEREFSLLEWELEHVHK